MSWNFSFMDKISVFSSVHCFAKRWRFYSGQFANCAIKSGSFKSFCTFHDAYSKDLICNLFLHYFHRSIRKIDDAKSFPSMSRICFDLLFDFTYITPLNVAYHNCQFKKTPPTFCFCSVSWDIIFIFRYPAQLDTEASKNIEFWSSEISK